MATGTAVVAAMLKRTAERAKFIEESRGALQDVVRRSLASRERATAITDTHRAVRRQSLHDMKEMREAGKKTEKEAREVLAKIQLWEKAAQVSEELAFEEADAVARRAETLEDAVALLAGLMERHNSHMERLAVFRMLNGPLPVAAAASD
ncbi:unnamed protein product [Ectocarpus sp. CCAP 1310/34]|nr:unnamed protein product [Ectocarpus sp. CCAP 1310/34]